MSPPRGFGVSDNVFAIIISPIIISPYNNFTPIIISPLRGFVIPDNIFVIIISPLRFTYISPLHKTLIPASFLSIAI